MNKECN